MHEKITVEDADICTCDVLYVDINGKIEREFKNNPQGYYENNDYLMACWYISNFMWDKLFGKDVFDSMRFDISLRTNEDVFLLFELMHKKRIVSIPRFLYNYLQRPSATSKGAPPTLIDDRVKIKNKQIEFSKKINRYEMDGGYISLVYLKHFLFNTIVITSRYSNSFKQDVRKIKSQLDKKFY